MAFSALVALTLHDVKNRLAAQAARAESAADLEARNALIESAETLSRLLTLFKAEQGLLGRRRLRIASISNASLRNTLPPLLYLTQH